MCEVSQADQQQQYRNYNEGVKKDLIKQTYSNIIQFQTLDYVLNMKKKYETFPNLKLSIWDAVELLDQIVDESDPDTDQPQHVHAYQTGDSIRQKFLDKDLKLKQNIEIKKIFKKEWEHLPQNVREMYEKYQYLHKMYEEIQEWDWFLLVGFIHDLGKVLLLKEFGGLPQWSVVGDIHPVGCKYNVENSIYQDEEMVKKNEDFQNSKLQTETGIYSKNCGFFNVHMIFSHDNYLADILKKNNSKLPQEAYYLIRFHSFYQWHTPPQSAIRCYQDLANEYDWKMLPLLKCLQSSDLYSKIREIPEMENKKMLYLELIKKYISDGEITW